MANINTLSQLISELQSENERLKELEKLFEKAIKIRFGKSSKEIEKSLRNSNKSEFLLEQKIIEFFDIKTESDLEAFKAVFFTEKSKAFFISQRQTQPTKQGF